MNPDASDVSGWLLVVGAVLFGIGAGDPYLVRAWTATQETYLAIVGRHPVAWRVTHVLFIGGTVLTTAGLVGLPGLLPDGWSRAFGQAGATAFALGAVLWIVSLTYRLAVTPTAARDVAGGAALDPSLAALDRLNGGLFTSFMVIALVGLAAIGVAVTAGGPIPAAVGWGAAALSGLCLGGLFLTGDMPPFTVYLAPLAFGIALLLGS